MERDVVFYGDPRLRKKCDEVTEITDEIKQLAQDLVDTCIAHDGVGIAAPQIGEMYRMFVTRFVKKGSDDQMELEEPVVFLNPRIFDHSQDAQAWPQGCLSIPEVYGEVIRPNKVTIEWMGLDGQKHERVLFGYNATIVMHENDHLNGVLFIDRLPPSERKKIEPLLRRVKKKYYVAQKK